MATTVSSTLNGQFSTERLRLIKSYGQRRGIFASKCNKIKGNKYHD